MVDAAVADCGCHSCGRDLINPDSQGTHFTRRNPAVAFRCLYCGRLFCAACAEQHFEEGGDG